ncbi:MAG: DUF4129 domain-containing protein [Solirubrobacteraceae bacterium]
MAVGVVVVLLLAIAAFGTRGSLAHVHEDGVAADARLPDPLAIAAAAGMLIVACGALYILVSQRTHHAPGPRNESPRAGFAVRVLAACVPLFILGLFVYVAVHPKPIPRPARGTATHTGGAARRAPRSAPIAPARGPSIWPPIVVLLAAAGAGAGAYALVLRRRRRDGPPPPRRSRGGTDGAAPDLIDPTRVADPRAAVVAAFARLEAELEAVGLPRRAGEGPLEFTARIAAGRPSLARPVRQLARLYAPARFSDHAVDEGMRRDALVALDAVRHDLAAVAQA